MAAATNQSEPAEAGNPGPARLLRFDRTERALHWSNAAVTAVLVATAAILYLGPLSALVGRRNLVRDIHVVAGLALPLPYLVALAGRWGAGLRRDAGRLNRWGPDDWRWLRSRGRDRSVRLGKFNPGQKLNAAFTAGVVLPMLVTGSIMRWFEPFPLAWRTGATFVHDWLAIAIVVAITGHVLKAVGEPAAMRAMVRGDVPAAWARRHRPRWYEEMAGTRPAVGGDEHPATSEAGSRSLEDSGADDSAGSCDEHPATGEVTGRSREDG